MASSPVDASRRRQEKRRQLDARRSKCRIRLGGHMEQWCLLKERLGFSLHSQLAKFLLDRLGAGAGCGGGRPGCPAQSPSTALCRPSAPPHLQRPRFGPTACAIGGFCGSLALLLVPGE